MQSTKLKSESSQSKHRDQGGRPPTWTINVLREMVVLDLYTHIKNEETLDILRKPNDGYRSRKLGKRNLFYKRNELYGPCGEQWRPQDTLTMCQRVAHSHNQRLASHDSRVFSLEPSQQIKLPNLPAALGTSDGHSDPLPPIWADTDKLTIKTVKAKDSDTASEKFRILLTRSDADCVVQVPSFTKSLSRLGYLDLSRNKLMRISAAILPPSLMHLDLRFNRISELSADLMDLQSLHVLALDHNSIAILPSWLADWNMLAILTVEGNPLGPFSYSHYYQAFESTRQETSRALCTKCLLVATRALKSMLSSNITQLEYTSDDIDECKCRTTSDITADDIIETLEDHTTLTESAVLSANGHIAAAFLNNHLYRLSQQSEDKRTSVSAFTLRTMSSAASDRVRFKSDKDDLLQLYCCGNQQGCIHIYTAIWLIDRAPYYKLPYKLSQANTSERDLNGNGVLHIMAALGAGPTDLKDCIANGADVMAVNNDGETFLHRTKAEPWDKVELGNFLGYLVCKNFRFNRQDNRGNTIFHKSQKFIKAARRAGVDSLRVCCCSYLRNADGIEVAVPAKTCSTTRVETCIGFCLNRTNTEQAARICFESHRYGGSECQHNECTGVKSEILHVLARMPQVGYQDFFIDESESPLDFSAALEILLNAGVEVNNYDRLGKSPLMRFVTTFGQHPGLLDDDQIKHCIRALLKAGANPAAVNRHGETVLHTTIHYGLPGVAALLIEGGANVNARNGKGLSVMQVLNEALHRMKPKLALKEQYKPKTSPELEANIKQFARYEQCRVILADHQAKVDPTVVEELQWTVGVAL